MGVANRVLAGLGLVKRHATLTYTAQELIPPRIGTAGVVVTPESARRSSAVWACQRIRADLISTMPLDAFKDVELEGRTVQVEVSKPPVMLSPYEDCDITEWLYSTQIDLDSYGNAVGIIRERTAVGTPAVIELVSAGEASIWRSADGKTKRWRIRGVEYDPRDVWHEKQFTVAGLELGLSPIAYAAWTLGGSLNAQQFAADWFGNDAIPTGHLKNTVAETLDPKAAAAVKDRWRAAVSGHDVFVTGKDWEFDLMGVPANAAAFIEQMKWGVVDVCRYFGVPADYLDAESGSSSITYANVTQRQLQLLVVNLNPTLVRRERALSKWLTGRRYAKFNRDSILAMDPLGRSQHFKTQIDARVMTPDEARALDNRPPLTDADYKQFERLFPAKQPDPAKPADGKAGA